MVQAGVEARLTYFVGALENSLIWNLEGWPPVTSIHSDGHLWPVWAVYNVIMESGDQSFLDEKVGFYDGGAASVYEHLCRAIQYTGQHLGPNGFPLMLRSDWNDQLFRVCRQGKGESIWTAMQLGVMLLKMSELARSRMHIHQTSLAPSWTNSGWPTYPGLLYIAATQYILGIC